MLILRDDVLMVKTNANFLAADEIKHAHQQLYPRDGQIHCQRLIVSYGDQEYAADPACILGGVLFVHQPTSMNTNVLPRTHCRTKITDRQ